MRKHIAVGLTVWFLDALVYIFEPGTRLVHLLRLDQVLLSSHHVTTALTVEHLLEFRIVLAVAERVVPTKVDSTAVRIVTLRRRVRRAHRGVRRLAIIILSHSGARINLLECDKVRLWELHLAVLIRFVGVTTILSAIGLWNDIDLAATALHVIAGGDHAQLADVWLGHIEVHAAVAMASDRICNDSTLVLRWHTTLTNGADILTLRRHHEVVTRCSEIDKALLVFRPKWGVVWYRHLSL